MPTDVRCLVETEQPYPVVRLVGELHLAAADQVSTALRDYLTEQFGGAIVVDVSQLTVADPAAVATLAALAERAAAWPAPTRLVLCGLADGAAAAWASSGQPNCTSPENALDALGESAPPVGLNLDLEPIVGASRRARELVTEACARWDRAGYAGPACIVVTEMVNNVVAHARTAMTVRVALLADGELLISVRDAAPGRPVLRGPVSPTAYGGRGLLLIDSVARRWGTLPTGTGKLVWAVLDADGALDG